jgi:hypothetical protein
MNRIVFRTIVLLVCLALLATSCSMPAQPTATQAEIPTKAPTKTPIPATETLLPPTDTPIPPTATAIPPIATVTATLTRTLGPLPTPIVPLADERYTIEGGGFSFQAPPDYSVETTLYSAKILSPDGMTVNITLSGQPNEEKKSLDDLRKEMTESEDFPVGEDVEIVDMTLSGEDALSLNMTVDIMMEANITMIMATPLDAVQVFSASFMVMDLSSFLGGEPPTEEETKVLQDTFTSILGSILFQEIPQSAHLPAFDLAKCSISEDETFGLSGDNPIILFKYPDSLLLGSDSRIGDYLAMLRGPNGEELKYELTGMSGTIMPGETTEDMKREVSVTYEGLSEPIILYILEVEPKTVDEIQQPQAPAGLTCAKQ